MADQQRLSRRQKIYCVNDQCLKANTVFSTVCIKLLNSLTKSITADERTFIETLPTNAFPNIELLKDALQIYSDNSIFGTQRDKLIEQFDIIEVNTADVKLLSTLQNHIEVYRTIVQNVTTATIDNSKPELSFIKLYPIFGTIQVVYNMTEHRWATFVTGTNGYKYDDYIPMLPSDPTYYCFWCCFQAISCCLFSADPKESAQGADLRRQLINDQQHYLSDLSFNITKDPTMKRKNTGSFIRLIRDAMRERNVMVSYLTFSQQFPKFISTIAGTTKHSLHPQLVSFPKKHQSIKINTSDVTTVTMAKSRIDQLHNRIYTEWSNYHFKAPVIAIPYHEDDNVQRLVEIEMLNQAVLSLIPELLTYYSCNEKS